VSISESGDSRSYGLSDTHFATLSDEIHLYLLLSGLRIAYGGALAGNFAQGANFTLRLFELVRGYSKLAEGVGAPQLGGAILNIAPWPLRLNYGDAEWRLCVVLSSCCRRVAKNTSPSPRCATAL